MEKYIKSYQEFNHLNIDLTVLNVSTVKNYFANEPFKNIYTNYLFEINKIS